MISVEDITGKYRTEEQVVDSKTGAKTTRAAMNIDETVKRIVATMRVREDSEKKALRRDHPGGRTRGISADELPERRAAR